MNGLETIASGPMWAAFVGFVLIMLALDLFVFGGNKAHKVSVKEAGIWSLVWVSLALLFNGGLWWYLNGTVGSEIADQKALEFFSGYLIEKALSVDNVFVFLLIFTAFQVPQQYQRRVLIYGVLGAIVMRAIMISAGAWVVSEFSWVLYIFGAFLLYTGMRMLVAVDQEPDGANNPVLKFARRHRKVSEEDHGEKFFVTKAGVRYVTPLFLVLILIEVTDLIFAVDSIPAIFAITTDPFIVYTSNIFAILGLRALYFALAALIHRFAYLKYALAAVLVFVGSKIFVADMLGIAKIPPAVSLGVTVAILATGIIGSLIATRKEEKAIE